MLWIKLLQAGAMGVSVACLLLVFRNNRDIHVRAAEISPATLRQLIGLTRWTMVFALLCLLSAAGIEVLSRNRSPLRLAIDVYPQDFRRWENELTFLRDIDQPILVKVAGTQSPISLRGGVGNADIVPGSTLNIQIDALLLATQSFAQAAKGEQNKRPVEAKL